MARSNAGRADLLPAVAEAVTVLASGARTTLQSSGVLTNAGGSQLIVYVNTTVIGSAALTVTIKGVVPAAQSTTYTILASAAINTNTLTILRVSPHLTASANAIAKEIVPALFQIDVAVADANPATYSVSYCLVP